MILIEKIKNAGIWKNKYLYAILLTLIVLYPLRWTFTGLDLWDSGYNCISYVCFGPEYMNPALFYSTFLSCVSGRLLSLLPFGDTFAGLRFYCGMVICANVLISSLFCIRKIKLNRWAVILGELLAVSLCYSPAVVLYNHLSFLLLTIAIILIYDGLVGDKGICLVAAGFILGLNVYTRFPNITQAVLILALWYHLWIRRAKLIEILNKTLFCIAGWMIAFLLGFALISAVYGKGSYVSGIQGLFGISEGAGDYSLTAMLMAMIGAYARGARRLADMAVFTAAAGLAAFVFQKISGQNEKVTDKTKQSEIFIGIIAGIGLIIFYIVRQLMQFDFHHYITVILTAAMFIDVVMILCLVIILNKGTDDSKKLFSALLLMQVIALSVGSNTGISPVMNNMFLMAPFMAHYLYSVLKDCEKDIIPGLYRIGPAERKILIKPAKRIGMIVFMIAMLSFFIQCVLFGIGYVYEEAGNGIGGQACVTDNRVLAGTRMSEERADWMQGITDYINKEQLQGHDAIVYGYAPALVYYLSLKPVIGSWPDLDSYATSSMKDDMEALKLRIDEKGVECPLIIFDEQNIKEQQEHNPEKWEILDDFMTKYGYSEAFSCGRFSIYRSVGR